MISLAKAAADPAGHYARPDVTRLLLNKTPGDRVVSFSAPGVEIDGRGGDPVSPGSSARRVRHPAAPHRRTHPPAPRPGRLRAAVPVLRRPQRARGQPGGDGLPRPAARGRPAVARRPRRRAGRRGRTRCTTTGPPATARSSPRAYWVDPDTFDRWWAAHRDSWLGDGVRDGHGRWAEIIRPRRGGARDAVLLARPPGRGGRAGRGHVRRGRRARVLGRDARPDPALADRPDAGLGAPAAEEDGGPRARPAARGPLPDPLRPGLDRHRRRRARACTSRTSSRCCGRAWSSCTTRARRWAVSPTATSPSIEAAPVERSYGMSWWRSLDALERWSESHPTHLAIFGAAMRYLVHAGPGRPAAALPRGLGAAGSTASSSSTSTAVPAPV